MATKTILVVFVCFISIQTFGADKRSNPDEDAPTIAQATLDGDIQTDVACWFLRRRADRKPCYNPPPIITQRAPCPKPTYVLPAPTQVFLAPAPAPAPVVNNYYYGHQEVAPEPICYPERRYHQNFSSYHTLRPAIDHFHCPYCGSAVLVIPQSWGVAYSHRCQR